MPIYNLNWASVERPVISMIRAREYPMRYKFVAKLLRQICEDTTSYLGANFFSIRAFRLIYCSTTNISSSIPARLHSSFTPSAFKGLTCHPWVAVNEIDQRTGLGFRVFQSKTRNRNLSHNQKCILPGMQAKIVLVGPRLQGTPKGCRPYPCIF